MDRGAGAITLHSRTHAEDTMNHPRQAAAMRFAVLLAFAPLPLRVAAAQGSGRDALILLLRADTFSVERFVRTARHFESELVIRMGNARITMSAELDGEGRVRTLDQAFRQASADPASTPSQFAKLTLIGDSAIVELTGGSGQTVQRLGTRAGAMPFINPSFALIELVLARASRQTGNTSVFPLFALQGGRTTDVQVVRTGEDSAVVDVGGVVFRLAVARDGTILGGTVPAQGLRIVRVHGATDKVLSVARPDYTAPADAPYTAEEVVVKSREGHTLAGTLTIPRGAKGAVAAFVTITGSGSQDRDEAIPIVKGYRLFRDVADALGRNGIAVLRMDDRGFGSSGGNTASATSRDFANDIRAGLEYLRNRPEVDRSRLGLIGHSEGGLIAPMIAAEDRSLRGIILMAGPSWTGRRVIDYQQKYALEHDHSLTAVRRDSLRRSITKSTDSLAAAVPWFRFFLDYDPLPTVKRVRSPVLILQGETDRQVTAIQARDLADALRTAGNRNVTTRVFPSANHLFVQDPSGDPSGYPALPSGAVRRDVLEALTAWARTTMARGK